MFRKEPITNATPHLQHVRRLTLFLASSVALNVILVMILAYAMSGGFLLSRCQVTGRFWGNSRGQITEDRTSVEILRSFAYMLPEQLVVLLNDSQRLQDGLMMRDLALGALISLHHFDVGRALHGYKLPKEHVFEIEDVLNRRIAVYPGLSDDQFSQVTAFVNSERWPLTAHGLFLALAQPDLRRDATLTEAFLLTQEFLTLQRLFTRMDETVERSEILDLVLEGDWGSLDTFYQTALQANESSQTLRRRMLLAYIQKGSPTAAALLVKTDGTYAARLDEASLLALLQLIHTVTPPIESFVAEVVHTPHSDEVLRLAHQLGSKDPVVAEKEVEPASRPEKIYVVQRGDSLWKISKQLKVSIETLKSYNKLTSDNLKPGTPLRIP